jgi:hypothetical protein
MSFCEQSFGSKFKNLVLLQKWTAIEKKSLITRSLARNTPWAWVLFIVDIIHYDLQGALSPGSKAIQHLRMLLCYLAIIEILYANHLPGLSNSLFKYCYHFEKMINRLASMIEYIKLKEWSIRPQRWPSWVYSCTMLNSN